jgi:hypothetical protein
VQRRAERDRRRACLGRQSPVAVLAPDRFLRVVFQLFSDSRPATPSGRRDSAALARVFVGPRPKRGERRDEFGAETLHFPQQPFNRGARASPATPSHARKPESKLVSRDSACSIACILAQPRAAALRPPSSGSVWSGSPSAPFQQCGSCANWCSRSIEARAGGLVAFPTQGDARRGGGSSVESGTVRRLTARARGA